MSQNKYISTKDAVRLTGLSTQEIQQFWGQVFRCDGCRDSGACPHGYSIEAASVGEPTV